MAPYPSTMVVGIDGSDTSVGALRWACREASLTGAEVEALIAWQWPIGFGSAVPIAADYDPAGDAQTVLEQVVEGLSPEFPPVRIHLRNIEGHPGEVLVEASRHAELLVVGCRGHGELTGLLLGSVSLYCATHAACPVLVFRPPAA